MRYGKKTGVYRFNVIYIDKIWNEIHNPKKAEYQQKAKLIDIFTLMYNQMDDYRTKLDNLNYSYQKMVKEYKESNHNLAILESIERLLQKQAEEQDEEEDTETDTRRERD